MRGYRFWDKTYKNMTYDDYYAVNNKGEVVIADSSWDAPHFTIEKDVIPLQNTSLKDKNGKEIYEGDVVSTNFWAGEVIYEQGKFTIDCKDGTTNNDLFGMLRVIEVIGNIYENLELLKV